MRNAAMLVVIIMVGLCASGCMSLSRSEQETLHEIRACGLSENEIQVKNPGAAGGLNILFGIGNFYLASGTDYPEHWAYGFINLLTWPLSITWGIPEAAIDAATINKKETIYYYTHDPKGKAEFERRKAQNVKPQ